MQQSAIATWMILLAGSAPINARTAEKKFTDCGIIKVLRHGTMDREFRLPMFSRFDGDSVCLNHAPNTP